MGKISLIERTRIIVLYQEGYSQRRIAQKTGYAKSSIQNIISKFKETGEVADKRKSGRPKKLSDANTKFLRVQSLRNRFKSSRELASDLRHATGTEVTSSSVRKYLISEGLRGRVSVRKPLLRQGNRQKRIQYAKEHKDWTAEMWNRVLYTDESKFEVFGSKRRQYVRRRPGERYISQCIQPTIKHGGGSVFVWGCISASGVGNLIRISDKLNARRYLQILKDFGVPSGRRLIGPNFMMQQDNDPKHTSRIVKNYLTEKSEEGVLEIMKWPPQSPDLNIIEHVWEYLDKKKAERQPTNAGECFKILREEWYKIPMDFISNLYASHPRRMSTVIQSKGGHTKY